VSDEKHSLAFAEAAMAKQPLYGGLGRRHVANRVCPDDKLVASRQAHRRNSPGGKLVSD
jgi:hypothetical protein